MPRYSRTLSLWFVASLASMATFARTSPVAAAPPFVDRGITLPRHDWAFDFGLGIAHNDRTGDPRFPTYTGAGLNLEGAVGITDRLELGLRTGVRFGDEGRATQADTYGRLFDRQTFGVNGDVMANPEVRFRGAVYRGDVAEVALEGRAYLPIEQGSRFGMMFGVPLLFHIGHSVRLDTGAFTPVLFYERTSFAVSLPLDVWIQATDKLWLGPITGLRFWHFDTNVDRTDVQLGFGLGYQIARAVDFKTMFYVPRINQDAGARNFGVGAGIQVRIE
jgi:hypothetical protein